MDNIERTFPIRLQLHPRFPKNPRRIASANNAYALRYAEIENTNRKLK